MGICVNLLWATTTKSSIKQAAEAHGNVEYFLFRKSLGLLLMLPGPLTILARSCMQGPDCVICGDV